MLIGDKNQDPINLCRKLIEPFSKEPCSKITKNLLFAFEAMDTIDLNFGASVEMIFNNDDFMQRIFDRKQETCLGGSHW